MTAEERRSSSRAPLTISLTEEYNARQQTVTGVNISEHGMHYIRPAAHPLRMGEEVLLTFSLLDRLQPITALAWVVEEREEADQIHTHATFMFLPDKDEQTILSYVENLV